MGIYKQINRTKKNFHYAKLIYLHVFKNKFPKSDITYACKFSRQNTTGQPVATHGTLPPNQEYCAVLVLNVTILFSLIALPVAI